jgi:hypothetical protein
VKHGTYGTCSPFPIFLCFFALFLYPTKGSAFRLKASKSRCGISLFDEPVNTVHERKFARKTGYDFGWQNLPGVFNLFVREDLVITQSESGEYGSDITKYDIKSKSWYGGYKLSPVPCLVGVKGPLEFTFGSF